MTTWYHPAEIKTQADGDQVQPEFDLDEEVLNAEDEVYQEAPLGDTVEVEGFLANEGAEELLERQNEVAEIVADEIDNGEEPVYP